MKPDSHQFEDRLLEFAYGELPAHEAGAVEAHVRGCERCRRALEDIRAVRATMRRLPTEEATAAGLDSLLAYAQGQADRNAGAAPRPWWKVPWGGRWLAPLGTLAALGLVVVVAWKSQSDPYQPAPATVALQAEESRGRSAEVAPEAALAVAPPPAAAAPAPAELARQLGERQAQVEKREAKAAPQAPGKLALAKDLAPSSSAGADFSNAAALGSLDRASAPVGGTQAKRKGYGLGTADQGPSKVAAAEPEAAQAPAPAPRDDRPAELKELAAAPAQAALAPGTAGAGPAPARASSLGLPAAESLRARQDRGEAAPATPAAPAAAVAVAAARQAGAARDRAGELRHALEALQAGVAGAERAEMLSRGCGAAEALADAEQADRLCDQLLLEFPGTPAAEALAARRGRVQSAPVPASRPAPAKPSGPVKK